MEPEKKKTILVVEDETDTLVHLSNILRRSGYEVIATDKGREGLEFAQKFLPDLILLDIVIPDMSGSDIAFTLSQDPAAANIPIIFLTGILTKEEEFSIKKAGKHLLMAKPITGKELLEMVRRALS